MSRPERIVEEVPYVQAMLNYLVDTTEKPESYGGVSQTVADEKRKGKYQEHRMTVYNGRALTDQLSLDREGFILVQHETRMKNFYDEDEIRSLYYKETEELVKQSLRSAPRSGLRPYPAFRGSCDARSKTNQRSGAQRAQRLHRMVRARSECATSYPTKQKNCSNIALP